MANPFAKGWKCMISSFDKKIENNADPKIQIAQAVKAERQRHQEIQRQAVTIIGNRNQLEMQLRRLTSERDKIAGNVRQAFANTDQARAEGDETAAQKMESTAKVFATQLVSVEEELEDTTQPHQQTVSAAGEAQHQAQQSQARYEQVKQGIRKLESQTDQAKMQEAASKALQSMQGIPEDPNVPTLDPVREKIGGRYANVLGAQELTKSSQAGHMAEIETLIHDAAADMRLAEIRVQINNESTVLESGSAAKGNAGELESVESAGSTEAVEDTTTGTDETKQLSPVANNR